MSNAAKVAEIFINAGTAFSKLGELTMELQKDEAKSCGGKWTDEEIELLKQSVLRFGSDIEKISQMVRSRTAKQIKEAIKRRNLIEPDEISNLITATSTNVEHKSLPTLIHTIHETNKIAKNAAKNEEDLSIEAPVKIISEQNMNSINSDHEIDVVNDSIVVNEILENPKVNANVNISSKDNK